MDIVPLVTAFTLIFFSELGDKTQLTVMALSSKASALTVFAGTMLAFFLVGGLSLLLGSGLLSLISHESIGVGAGLLFILVGVISLVRSGKRAEIEDKRATFLKTASIVSIMELGDKTQLAAILLAAEFGNPLMVMAGMMSAFFAVTAIGIAFGARLMGRLPEKHLRVGTAILFVLFVFAFLHEAIIK